MPAKPRVRRAVFANPPVQGIALRRLVFYWTAYHLVLWLSLFLYRYSQYQTHLLAGGSPLSLTELYGRFTREHYPVIVCALAILPLLIWDVLNLTHRILGPLVRFRHCLKLLARGERVTEIRLRQGDMLAELQDAFNEFLASPYNPGRIGIEGRAPTIAANTLSASEDRLSAELLACTREVQSGFFRSCQSDGTPRPVPLPTATHASTVWLND